MATAPGDVDAASLGKVKVKVQAEFWIDPLDHIPLEERGAMLLTGRQMESRGSFTTGGVDAVRKQVTTPLLLEMFMSRLAHALKPLSVHGHQEQILTESSSQYNLKNGKSSGEQIYDGGFTGRRSMGIQDNAVVINFEPVQMSSHMAVDFEERHPFEDCRSEDSQPNVCRPKGCSSGRKDAGAGSDDMVLSSSPDHIIKAKVEPSDACVQRDACVPFESKTNKLTKAELEHVDHVSLHFEGCKLPLFSSIAGGCSQMDVSLESDHCYSSLAEAGNVTTTQGKTPICYSEAAYQEDLSNHSQDISEQVFSYPEDDVKGLGANKLDDGLNCVGIEFQLEKSVVDSSEVNAVELIYTSMNDIPESSIASFPCMSAQIMQGAEDCNDINSDGTCGAGSVAAVAGLAKESSLKSNKGRSDPILSTDPVRIKYKAGDKYYLSDESAAKRMRSSISVYPVSCARNQVSNVLSDACTDNISCGTRNLLEKEVQAPAGGQKEREFKNDCLLHDSFLSSSIVMVKVELADEDPDVQLSETDALTKSCWLHPGPTTEGTVQAFICQDNVPSVVHNIQENHELGGTCSQESSSNCLKVPFVAEQDGNFGTEGQLCVSALSFSHAIVKVEGTEGNSKNHVLAANAANDLCGSVLCSQGGSAIRSRDDLPEEKCYNQASEASVARHVQASVSDSQENSIPMKLSGVAEMLTEDVSYKQHVSSPANTLQGNEQHTMFSYRMSEDVLVALKAKTCSDTGSQSADGACSLSPGVKVELPEEIHAVCSSETTTVTEFSTSTYDSSITFVRDNCQATLSGTCNMQTIREGETMCSEKMSINVPAGSKVRDVLPLSVLSAFPKTVKKETVEGNHTGNVSETKATVNPSASEPSDESARTNACAGTPVGDDLETYCNVTGLIPDSVLSVFPMTVKDEPLEDDLVCGSESMTEKGSGLSIFHSPINDVILNPVQNIQYSSKAINCQRDSSSGVRKIPNDKETIITSSQINIPEDTRIVTGQKQTSMGDQHIYSDVSASKGINNVEQLGKSCTNIISENTVTSLNSSCSSTNLILKAEPIQAAIQNLCSNSLGPSCDMLSVEAKGAMVDELPIDILDHMPLTERTKMLAFSMASEMKPARKSRCFKQTRVHAVGRDSVDSVKVKAKSSTNRRKKKKTATDSVEIALEEDAPGLLQGLLDRGINLDEIKLYGCEEDVDALDISSNDDLFEELEAVISKLFSERPTSLFKLAPLRNAKSTKAGYCLACLISLIEQTRYLQFRNCPVEWGWCRDLQSFIFVFKMHNRIVLERPEYGYATYFFEIVESFPIDWQIKRLVTAMKLTSCSRATLIENKSLLVGVDLSEGEACVLEEYGWVPNTGLGSMLNYCDRVVHDRNERDVSEWRMKIGKLLMDGYDGGRVVKINLPKKVVDYVGNHYPEIKMET